MSSIAGALVATAAGLFVAIPAVVLHNLLQARVDWILDESRQLRGILVARSVQAVAEGVEDAATLHRLQGFGCEFGQGFHWSPALPAEGFCALVRNHQDSVA